MPHVFCRLLVAVMVMTPPMANAQPPLLEGTSWQTTGEVETDRPFISFAADGRFSGFAGCNRIMGRYELRDRLLTIGRVGSTRMACVPDVMAKEAAFIEMLGKTRRISSEDKLLRLFDETGIELGILEQRSS